MAAIGAIASMLKSGDHVIVSDNVYGGTFRLFDKVLSALPVDVHATSTPPISTRSSARSRPTTRMLFVETPSNPVMRLTDLRAAADLAHRHGARLVVDNTFASPVHPAADRARRRPRHPQHDEVPERPQRQRRRRRHRRRATTTSSGCGSCRTPRARSSARSTRGWCCAAPRRCRCAWQQHSANGLALAEFLAGAPEGAARPLPGAAVAPAARARRAPDARVRRDAGVRRSARSRRARRLLNGVRLMALAESLGGVETLISHPATMTHASVPAERARSTRHHRRPGPHLGRRRGHRGPQGRSRPGARRGSDAVARSEHPCPNSSISSSTSTAICSRSSPTYGALDLRDPVRRSSSRRPASSSRRSCPATRCSSPPAPLRRPVRSTSASPRCCCSLAAIAGDAVNYAVGRAVGRARHHTGADRPALAAAGSIPRTSRARTSSSSGTAARRSCSGGSCRSSGRSCRSSPARPRCPTPAFAFYNMTGAHCLGRPLPRRRLPVRQRADRQGELLAGGARHRRRLGAADGHRVPALPGAPVEDLTQSRYAGLPAATGTTRNSGSCTEWSSWMRFWSAPTCTCVVLMTSGYSVARSTAPAQRYVEWTWAETVTHAASRSSTSAAAMRFPASTESTVVRIMHYVSHGHSGSQNVRLKSDATYRFSTSSFALSTCLFALGTVFVCTAPALCCTCVHPTTCPPTPRETSRAAVAAAGRAARARFCASCSPPSQSCSS